jgi:hypothetical protein
MLSSTLYISVHVYSRLDAVEGTMILFTQYAYSISTHVARRKSNNTVHRTSSKCNYSLKIATVRQRTTWDEIPHES